MDELRFFIHWEYLLGCQNKMRLVSPIMMNVKG